MCTGTDLLLRVVLDLVGECTRGVPPGDRRGAHVVAELEHGPGAEVAARDGPDAEGVLHRRGEVATEGGTNTRRGASSGARAGASSACLFLKPRLLDPEMIL